MDDKIKNKLQCPYENKIFGICVNGKCNRSAILCEKGYLENSECGNFHDNCMKVQWTKITDLIGHNPHVCCPDFHNIIDKMDSFFEKTLEKIRQEHQKFKFWVKTYGYSIEVMKFIKEISQHDYSNLTGHYLQPIVTEILNAKRLAHMPAVGQTEIIILEDLILDNLNRISDVYLNPGSIKPKNGETAQNSIHSSKLQQDPVMFDSEPLNKSNHKNHRNNIVKPDNDLFSTPVNAINSKILSDSESIKSLFEVKVSKVDLLFRASDKKFDIREFHKSCDEISHTLVLIQTEFGKVIGGYTPIPWRSTKKHWAPDKLQESFVFSLNMREKFKLNLAQFAIANNPEKGPIFGCCDICIVDKANKQRCNSEFPISYNNGRYVRSPDTCFAFTGHPKGKYLVKEWEVFKIIFE